MSVNMNKNGQSKAKYYIQSEKHPMQVSFGLCTLMEHQSLVDIAICCGSNVLHAHKVVLAASSPLFRAELEQNPSIEQVIISGCEFTVIRSLIEFIYCGETFVNEDLVKYFVAAARLFQMKNLENLSLNYQFSDNFIVLPKPQFVSKKPKYPAFPFKNTSPPSNTPFKPMNYNMPNLYKPQKVKRKLRMEAEHQACLKEALASRLAIANLKKEIGSAPQPPTFIIEDSCTETTVENFIPNTDGSGFVELNMNGQLIIPDDRSFGQESANKSSIIQLTLQNGEQNWTADKIKKFLGNQANSNVEIMFRTNDGNFVTVTDEVLQNLQKDGLQYQVIDEDGKMGEIQELRLLNKDQPEKTEKTTADNVCNIEFLPSPKNIQLPTDADIDPLETVVEEVLLKPEDVLITESPEIKPTVFEVANFLQQATKTEDEVVLPITEKLSLESSKFSPDIFFAEAGESLEHQQKMGLL